jgi:hypothetical protein
MSDNALLQEEWPFCQGIDFKRLFAASDCLVRIFERISAFKRPRWIAGLLSTQPGRLDRRLRFSKAVVRQAFGDFGSEWKAVGSAAHFAVLRHGVRVAGPVLRRVIAFARHASQPSPSTETARLLRQVENCG